MDRIAFRLNGIGNYVVYSVQQNDQTTYRYLMVLLIKALMQMIGNLCYPINLKMI